MTFGFLGQAIMRFEWARYPRERDPQEVHEASSVVATVVAETTDALTKIARPPVGRYVNNLDSDDKLIEFARKVYYESVKYNRRLLDATKKTILNGMHESRQLMQSDDDNEAREGRSALRAWAIEYCLATYYVPSDPS